MTPYGPDILGTILAVWGVMLLLGLGVYVWYAVMLSRLFPRLGAEGWKGWVPLLNEAEILRLGGVPAWSVVFYVLPFVNIYGLYLKAVATSRINAQFGKGAGMTVLAILLPPVWATLLVTGSRPADPALEERIAPSMPERSGYAFAVTTPAADPQQPAPPVPPLPAPPTGAVPPAAPPPPFGGVPSAAPPPPPPPPMPPAAPPPPGAPSPAAPPPPPSAPASAPAPAAPPSGMLPPPPLVAPPAPPVPSAPPAPPAAAPAPPVEAAAPAAPAAPPAPRPEPTEPAHIVPPPGLLIPPPPTPATLPPAPATPVAAPSPAPSIPAQPWAPLTGPAPAAPPAPVASPVPEPAADDDDAGEELDRTVVVDRRPRIPWVLRVDDGPEFRLTGASVVLGRRPSGGTPGAQEIAVPDATRTLSKVHARLDLADGVWTVTDLNATNGVIVVAADGSEELLDPGAAAPIVERFVLGKVGMRIVVDSGDAAR